VSRVDRIKEELGWLKLVFGVLVAIDVSLLAWLAQNYSDADNILVVASLLATAVLTGVIVWLNRMAYRRIEELEGL
jgi:hypothetical protein